MPPQKRKARRAATRKLPASQGSDDEEPPAPPTKRQRLSLRRKATASTAGQDAKSTPAGAASSDKKPLDASLPPIYDVREMMEDMVKRFGPVALQKSQFKLKVATLCSGTEAPIFALNMLLQYFKAINPHGVYEVEHIFSCEIEPFKQGFIYRNIPPGIILFRDAGEMATAAPNGEA